MGLTDKKDYEAESQFTLNLYNSMVLINSALISMLKAQME